ncbi:hypothetical protein EI94DRAFT_1304519 [Lactarius quietus]|nr:hypothetical protein EI94DRAFT_1304519 [Lactarius quietus]
MSTSAYVSISPIFFATACQTDELLSIVYALPCGAHVSSEKVVIRGRGRDSTELRDRAASEAQTWAGSR